MAAEPKAGGRSTLRRYGPLGAAILIAQITVAWFLIRVLLAPAAPVKAAEDEMLKQTLTGQDVTAPAKQERRLPYYYAPEPLRKLVVNPSRSNAERFLMTSIELGLKAYDRDKKPPKDDITAKLGKDAAMLTVLDKYASKMRAICIESLGKHSIDEFDRQELIPVQAEIRQRINTEVLQPAFSGDKSKRSVVVVEVLFTEMVIQ